MPNAPMASDSQSLPAWLTRNNSRSTSTTFFPLEEARQAHERLEERHNRSEIVLSVAGSPS